VQSLAFPTQQSTVAWLGEGKVGGSCDPFSVPSPGIWHMTFPWRPSFFDLGVALISLTYPFLHSLSGSLQQLRGQTGPWEVYRLE
jgi:hypothetical protein